MLKIIIKKFYSVLRKHIWIDVRGGNLSKPIHFLKIVFKNKFLGYPYSALIETGNYCNLCCPTCTTPAKTIKRKKELMSFENFKKIIDNIKDSVHIVHIYYSGEPLLHPEIFKMAKYAHQNNLFTSISTNVTLLNEEKTEELFESGLDEIIVCFDGISKESYESFRLGANFDNVLKNIKYLCRQKQVLKLKKPFIELQFILNKFNQNEIKGIKKLARELKIDRLHIKSFALGEYAYSKKEIEELAEKFFPDTKKHPDLKTRYKREDGCLIMKTYLKKCPMVRRQAFILVDGRLSMCCYDLSGNYILDSILDRKLKDIWFDKEIRRKHKLAEERQYPLCKLCSIH